MKLKEIAEKISAHLARFERDAMINKPCPTLKKRPYYFARAFASGNRVGVVYVNYQHHSYLTKADAIAYLDWLDAGNIGDHWRVKRGVKA